MLLLPQLLLFLLIAVGLLLVAAGRCWRWLLLLLLFSIASCDTMHLLLSVNCLPLTSPFALPSPQSQTQMLSHIAAAALQRDRQHRPAAAASVALVRFTSADPPCWRSNALPMHLQQASLARTVDDEFTTAHSLNHRESPWP